MLKVMECFGGIGACSKGLENLGIEHELVEYIELDKHAVKSFNAIHNTSFLPQDITTWDKDLEVDLIMSGSPCQSFSIVGKQEGGDEGSGTKSSLLYETIRIITKLRPKYVIWENVKNVLGQKHKHNFDNYLKEMVKLGYSNFYQVMNAKDYGLPHNRDRVFTVSVRDYYEFIVDNIDDFGYIESHHEPVQYEFTFPSKEELITRFKDIVELDKKWEVPRHIIKSFATKTGDFSRRFTTRGLDDIATCVTTKPNWAVITNNYFTEHFEKRSIQEIYNNNIPLYTISPRCAWRLMGFSDEDFDKASVDSSPGQLYKQAGNSIAVPVIQKILAELLT